MRCHLLFFEDCELGKSSGALRKVLTGPKRDLARPWPSSGYWDNK